MPDAVVDRLNVALEGRYRLERELGQGGMANVYLAKDLRHGRDVALKVMKPELSAAVGAARFLSEIRTTANLQHPHILPLFDSGVADGFLFYTMPYVEGVTLRSRLEQQGRLEVDEAVQIATDVSEAVQVAHERGIVHRDIKPSNILLSRGGALVADFGIAFALTASADARLTATGSSMGTAGYMSPEQASGEQVDARADVYSLGCVLFEMLGGDPPYGRGSLISILKRQVADPVPSVRATRPELPVALDRVLAAAMAQDPAERFASAAAFAAALSASREAGVAASVEKTVLVLPFVNRSPDPENEYFSDGLTEEVISDLAGISALSVISRNSAMTLKGTTQDTRALARQHGVTHLVTGSARKAGNSLRVTVELVEATSDKPLWSEKFSGTADDVFRIQEEISHEIVTALEVRLTDAERKEAEARPFGDPVAYDCYLRARQLTYEWNEEAQRRALGLVDQAILLAGESALLLATKGQIRWNMVNSGVAALGEGLQEASTLADRALALHPDHPVAIFVRGLVAATRGRIEAALVDLYKAHRMRPSDGNILLELIRWSMSAGLESVASYSNQLLRIEPLMPLTHLGYGHELVMRGQRDAVLPAIQRAVALTPSLRLHAMAGWILAEGGWRDEALRVLDGVGAVQSNDPHRAEALFLAAALRGKEHEALRSLTGDAESRLHSEWDFLSLASGYAQLGQTAPAVAWLRRAVQAGFISHPFLSDQSLLLAPLRGEQDFEALMAEVKPRWESVVAWEQGLEG